MKKVLWIFAGALLFSNLFLLTGCGEDETGTGNDLAPLVQITAGGDTTVTGIGETFFVTVEVTKGTNPVESVTITKDGSQVDASNIVSITGITTPNNPQLVTGTDVDGFTWTIEIKTEELGENDYAVKVEDTKGLTDEATFHAHADEPISQTITGATIQLENAAGPAGTGGIDLDTGDGTGSTNAAAELRDMGIDSLAGSGDNWRRRVGGVNGTEVKILGAGAPEGFDFDKIDSKEAIEGLFTDADDFTDTLPTWGSFKVSPEVNTGDVFVVKSGSTYYLVQVDNVTETTVLGDNTDNYQVTIKY